jgi:hypothetical protein
MNLVRNRNSGQPLTVGNVRFGSLADTCGASTHVRFAPDSDRESGLSQKARSASPPEADIASLIDDFVGAG